jgi:hypothetical protein
LVFATRGFTVVDGRLAFVKQHAYTPVPNDETLISNKWHVYNNPFLADDVYADSSMVDSDSGAETS